MFSCCKTGRVAEFINAQMHENAKNTESTNTNWQFKYTTVEDIRSLSVKNLQKAAETN